MISAGVRALLSVASRAKGRSKQLLLGLGLLLLLVPAFSSTLRLHLLPFLRLVILYSNYLLVMGVLAVVVAFRSPLLGSLDLVVSLLRHRSPENFRHGVGDIGLCDQMMHAFAVSSEAPTAMLHTVELLYRETEGCALGDGHFLSPASQFLRGPVATVDFQVVLPSGRRLESIPKDTALCLLFPPYGDETFDSRRKSYAMPLLKEHGVVSVIVQVPFCGARRSEGQRSAAMLEAVHAGQQGFSASWEAIALLQHLQRHYGFQGPFVVAGLSFGGLVASLTAVLATCDLGAVSLVPPHSPAPSFLGGLFSSTVAWDALGGDAQRRLFRLFHRFDIPSIAHRIASKRTHSRRLFFHQISCPDDHFVTLDSQLTMFNTVRDFHATRHAELEMAPGGHVAAFLLHAPRLVRAVARVVHMLRTHHDR